MSDSSTLSIKPVIHYPRIAQVGKTYAMTIDLQPDEDFEWNYEQEEYPIHCVVDSDCFKCRPVGSTVIVLHRFGGNYGSAKFYLTANKEISQGGIKVVLVNAWGITIKSFSLDQVQILSKTSDDIDTDASEILTEVRAFASLHGEDKDDRDSSKGSSSSSEAQKEASLLPAGRAIILTALPVEYQAVRSHLTELQEEAHPYGTIYERGKFRENEQEWDIGLVEVGVGSVNSAVEAERAIEYFKPDIIFFVGIASGIKDVRIGDVVAVTDVYSYESGKANEKEFSARPQLWKSTYAVVQRAKTEARKGKWLRRLAGNNNSRPRVLVAPIAAGEKVIASTDSELFQFLRNSYNDVIAVEMEGYGFLNAAFAYSDIETMVIRGISDLINDKNASDSIEGTEEEPQEKASYNASAFAFQILAELRIEEFIADAADESRVQKSRHTPNFFAYDEAWVGREGLVASLSDRIRGNCRLLIMVGMTGIGKTALGERLSIEVADWFDNDWSHYHQENFDDEQQSSDFVSVAARWLEQWGELIIPNDRTDPQRLLHRTVRFLCEHRYLVQMDSLQRILKGNTEEGWSEFKDKWWLQFFDSYLNADTCQSSILLTSQDLPGQLEEIGTRSQTFWHCELLSGLETAEQLALFEKTQLDITPQSANREYLERIGKAYEGHPLALRVIAGEIKNRPFLGNVLAYWNRYGHEVEAVEESIAQADVGNFTGSDDQWRLDRFTKVLRRNMKARLDETFNRLREESQWAYILLCETSVYRCPVPENFWLAHLEDWERDENEQLIALDVLRERLLIEESINNENHILLRQSNLIRSVALENLKTLDEIALANATSHTQEGSTLPNPTLAKLGLNSDTISLLSSRIERGHYRAVINWLTQYKPEQTASNLEKVQGYLEAFSHLCTMRNWTAAEAIVSIEVGTTVQEPLLEKLGVWGYYTTQIFVATQVCSGQLSHAANVRVKNCLGVAHNALGNYDKSIDYYSQALSIARETQNIAAETAALGNLGNVYYSLGDFQRAIELLERQLSISRQISDLSGEANALGNLGNVYYLLGDYQRAIELLERQLSISRQISDLSGEANALGNLGNVYYSLNDYQRAIELLQRQLSISQQLGNRIGEANALGNLGNTYYSLGDYQRAIEFLQQQLSISRQLQNQPGIANALCNLGMTFLHLKDFESSLEYLQLSIKIFERIGNQMSIADVLKSMSIAYIGLNNFASARVCCDRAIDIAEEISIPNFLEECERIKYRIESQSSSKSISSDIDESIIIVGDNNTANINLNFQ